ncbi:hypothetical protein [Streptomyces sp. NPDC059076]|uniref:hypothetical protein n=1 Tax=unclassified Streptomyces TaxID=2593676 RepID=UPI0036BFD4BE
MNFEQQVSAVTTQVAQVCDNLADLEPARRLPLLVRLRRDLDATLDQALDTGRAAASELGWGLRGIGAASDISHEHVRLRVATGHQRSAGKTQ